MIVTRKNFSKKTGIDYGMVCIMFDKFSITALDAYKNKSINYDVSWYDLNKMKDYLLDRKRGDFTKQILILNKLCED